MELLERPRCNSSVHHADAGESCALQNPGRFVAAERRFAEGDDLLVLRQLAQPRAQRTQRDERCAGQTLLLVLRRAANIEEEGILLGIEPGFDFPSRNGWHLAV